ncbi:MAG: calcineurin-like phosphoesterase C-terminal domain-containing protein [Bacteroidales bacterium]|nr:calcineurin-like phosphoesterase C-terminal domain-containing protein [Bacteroidales bacterium]
MKKTILTLGLILACAYAWAQGIGSAKDLQEFIDACNSGASLLPWSNADSVVVLTADIDLSKAKKMPQVVSFSGKFDGQGHSLKGWKATKGLFNTIAKDGEVASIVIDASCSLNAVSKGEEFYCGFIADKNFGIVRDCVNKGRVTHKCGYALSAIGVGGIVGFNRYAVVRCSNYGEISSDVQGAPKEEVTLSVGGIIGQGAGKATACSVAARCVNEGYVHAVSNLMSVFVGGITGNAVRTTQKYNTNRGAVTVEVLAAEDGGTKNIGRAAGIAGQTKSTIIRCYNYGEIVGKGDCGSNVGGIVGMPHESLVIADCYNFGKVTALGEQPSQVGGIAGNIGRPVHIRGCFNYGDIRFDGVSQRARSAAGGIVGSIYCPKSQTAGAYVRNCVNHGNISCSAGGNKYDASNRNAIHAAGIVGYAEALPGLRAFVYDCSSDGKVTCPGRKGEIVGSAIGVKTGGQAPDEYAAAANPLPDGTTLSGKVSTPDGKPLEGIVVTDGLQCVKTASDGSYALKSDLTKVRFVYLSLPSNVVIPTRNGVPQFFRRIPYGAAAATADFTLETREPVKDYTVMMIADPQVRPYGWDNSMERWDDTVAPDAEAFRASCPGEVYSINLGDLVYNEMYAWDDYMDVAAKIQCPTFNVIGNHDYDQMTLFETAQGDVYYETYVGPTRYSFDLGDIHYMVMNDILYDRKSANDKYHYGFDDETFAWIKADLAFVPKDKIIMTCNHNNPFKTPNTSPHGSHNFYSVNYAEYLALFSSYKEVYAWNGHSHVNFYYNYANHFGKDTKHGAPNIQCISVTRATGALRFNKPIAALGEPQGYMVMNVKGEEVSWYYKAVGHGQDYQLKVYPPARTDGELVKANIWNWSEGWSQPEWSEDGVNWKEMEFTPGIDPDYYDLFSALEDKTTRKYCQPSKNSYLFSVTPSPGCTGGTVRVKDMFGKEYSERINW